MLPPRLEDLKVKAPPRWSDLSPEERKAMSEEELLEALAEEEPEWEEFLLARRLKEKLAAQHAGLRERASSESTILERSSPSPDPSESM
jgi:hypothetical protein